ncbi:MAG: OsmC family protein [candidate division WOR-3 bacterium]
MRHEAHIRWAGRMTFIGRAGSNHLVPMDSGSDFGGDNSATKPMELLLLGLGGCTGMDVVSLLHKMRVPFTNLEMNITADRTEEYPTVYRRIDIEYVVTGHNLDEEKVKRAIELSQEKYCSVSAMLRKACPVNFAWRVVEP